MSGWGGRSWWVVEGDGGYPRNAPPGFDKLSHQCLSLSKANLYPKNRKRGMYAHLSCRNIS
jgi:hypothetical protein